MRKISLCALFELDGACVRDADPTVHALLYGARLLNQFISHFKHQYTDAALSHEGHVSCIHE